MAISPGHEQALAPKPVSSSSLDTTFSAHNDVPVDHNPSQPFTTQQYIDTSMPQLDSTHPTQPMQPNHFNISPETFQHAPPIGTSHDEMHISPSTGVIVPSSAVPNTNTVPEFLYQLTKMLTDNNRDIIEWSNGKIEVHNPYKLQTHVLNRYFRHSKFASFQRQLNYFGFRKLAGKGKMAPCSYVNDATTKDLGSLLLIKRKVGNEPKAKAPKKRERADSNSEDKHTEDSPKPPVNPILANILYRSGAESQALGGPVNISRNIHPTPNQSQQEIARVAVGRGIRHSFSSSRTIKPAPLPPRPLPSEQVPNASVAAGTNHTAPVVEASLSALKNNFQIAASAKVDNSNDEAGDAKIDSGYVPGSMRRDDSLVDLAMIPWVDDGNEQMDFFSSSGLPFIDFSWQDPNTPSSSG